MATEQPPFQYHLDFRVNHQGDIDGQCKELLFRLRPEWKQQELKSKVSEQELKTVSSQAVWAHDDIMFTHSEPFAGEYTGQRWFFLTKGQWCGAFMIYLMHACQSFVSIYVSYTEVRLDTDKMSRQ